MAGRAVRLFRAIWRSRWALLGLTFAAMLLFAGYTVYDYRRDVAESFKEPVMQFKYGSTGGDRLAGIPVGIFNALPILCRDYLPRDYLSGGGWQSLGLVFEKGMDRPVGTSMRRSFGFDRISLNCATCHFGTYRVTAADQPIPVPGMPAHQLDLERMVQFLISCARDERFNPWQVVQAAERTGARYSPWQRLLLRYIVVPAMREGLIFASYRVRFFDKETELGPGRIDTFGPEKALLNWPFEHVPARQMTGVVDFPSLWLQAPREGMRLHWDGNNDSLAERNRSAAFGTGAVPTLADRESLAAIEQYLVSPANHPPDFPLPIDQVRADRGAVLYRQYCADCHGASGRDFSGPLVGKVDPIEHIRTDPCRLDNYTEELSVEQGNLYAAYPEERFSHFRKTHGYANLPLDGIWLRGPYLHNGSVPTVRDLLEPAEKRPAMFWRGNDVIDAVRLGFVSNVPEQGGSTYFPYETRCVKTSEYCAIKTEEWNKDNPPQPDAGQHDPNICVPGPWAGNSNRGHEGREFGTELADGDKDDLVEFLKKF